MNGIFLIDKPAGITSHDIVEQIRRRFRISRVGHAGTLDPLATGLMIILLGTSTKLSDQFLDFDKAYLSTMRLGTSTDTADIDGNVLKTQAFEHITQSQVEDVMKNFEGEQQQFPPMYSAVKIQGKRLYALARRGIEVERKSRTIKVSDLRLKFFESPHVQFHMECSKGTFVRQLAQDMGNRLGCGACITQIRRTRVGPFTIDEATTLSDVHASHLRNWQG